LLSWCCKSRSTNAAVTGSHRNDAKVAETSGDRSGTMLKRSATVKLPYCGGTTAWTSWYVVSSAARPPTARLPGVGFLANVANLIV
jgi:hypothetical protein